MSIPFLTPDVESDNDTLIDDSEKEPLLPQLEAASAAADRNVPVRVTRTNGPANRTTVKEWSEKVREKRNGKLVLVDYKCEEYREELQVLPNKWFAAKDDPSKGHTIFFATGYGVMLVWILILLFTGWDGTELNARILRPFGFYTNYWAHRELGEHCAHIQPIGAEEFYTRQQALANVLHDKENAVYVAEPGAFAQYFGNISQKDWSLSERPLLFVVSPETSGPEVKPRLTIVTPTFEADRAHLLTVPSEFNVTFTQWDEDANPYVAAMNAFVGDGPVFVDSAMRKFVADGLEEAASGREVLTAPKEVTTIRERKSEAELEILRCANEVTLNAIRVVRKDMKIGMNETEARDMMKKALEEAKLSEVFVLGLFGENAALPHGSGTDRKLGKEDFILFDVGGSLHGYHSDITRTFALKGSKIPAGQVEVWGMVNYAQRVGLETVRQGTLTFEPDEAVRAVMKTFGNLDQHFTHRLGHGLGLETHESPYLVGGSSDLILPGHVFSDEPGVYVRGSFGIRLEDPFHVNEDGKGVLLTEGVGGQAKSPWDI